MLDVPNFDVHDASTVTLTFASGAVCTITSACIARQSPYAGLTVYTRDRTVELTSGKLTVSEPGRKEIIENQNDTYFEENRIFIEAVKSKDPSKIKSTYADAVQTLKVTLAANQSIAEGRPIQL
jgi:predicted dehydrogenase